VSFDADRSALDLVGAHDGLVQPGDDLDEGRPARSVVAEHARDLAAADLEPAILCSMVRLTC
jgi:hypothetical protein